MKNLLLLTLALFSITFSFATGDPALGIKAHQIHPNNAESRGLNMPYGSLVRYVYPGSAAEEMGIQIFDYIYEVNGLQASDTASIGRLVNNLEVGAPVEVKFMRAGIPLTASSNLSNGYELDRPHRSSEKDPFLGVSANHSDKPDNITGISVDIVDNSTAQAMGLEDDDIILKIDGYQLYNWSDLHAAIDNREIGDPIQITYYREGNITTESRPIKSRAATHNDHSRANGPQIIGTPQPGLEPVQVELEVPTPAEVAPIQIDGEPIPVVSDIPVEELNVFPNPSDGIFNIQLELPQEGRTIIQVFDGSGKQVYLNNLGNFQGIFSDRIDIANTAKGIYFLLVRQGDKTISRRLVLQ
ncbi:MAG: PDZ domain-containing protein [Bacteroidota bacterium]